MNQFSKVHEQIEKTLDNEKLGEPMLEILKTKIYKTK